jgi:hypothetical protein
MTTSSRQDAPTQSPIAISEGGTGADNESDARDNLGLGTLATQNGTFSGSSSGTNTGDQTITLTGDVTGSGTGSFAATIPANTITEAKQILADNTTGDASTTKHGYCPKIPNDGTKSLSGKTGTWIAKATYQGTQSNPTGTNNATGLMMGLAGAITPTVSGTVVIHIVGDVSAANAAGTMQIYYGTGTAPANGVAITGTPAGSLLTQNLPTSRRIPFSLVAVVTGLTVGTTYWIDMMLGGDGSITQTPRNVSISSYEL